MIRFGPAGIPLSCKGRTLEDGIEDVHNLSLTALEIQMVRAGTYETYPEEEDVGIPFKDLDGRFIVGIMRDDEPIYDPMTPVEEEDTLIQMVSGIADNFGMLYDLGTMAKRLDVSVSLHTPNYMELGSDSPLTEQCVDSIIHAGLIVNALGGEIVTTNLGIYSGDDDETTENNIYANLEYITDLWKDMGLKPLLGIEITGNQNVFGSLDQVCDVCDNFDNLVPVINWPSYHSRSRDNDINNMILGEKDAYLLEAENFKNVIDDIAPYYKNGANIHTIFSGIEHTDENRYRLTPIKKGDLKFDTLSECLVDMKPNMTIISSSPLLEHDAMYMRIIHERTLLKKVAKALRLRKKEESEALAAASGDGQE